MLGSRSTNLRFLFLSFLLLIVFTFYLLVQLSGDVNQLNGRDLDDFCLQQNKWGRFDERLAEQRRIFASIRAEHVEVIRRFNDTTHELHRLLQLIPQKQDELEELKQKIETLKLAARELQDQRNVRLFLPHQPIWFNKSEVVDEQSPTVFRTIEESFDFRRCSISTRFRVFLYEKTFSSSDFGSRLYNQIQQSRYRTLDPDKACLFVGFVDDNENPKRWSHWGEFGRNHLLIFGSQSPVTTSEFGAAIVVAEHVKKRRHGMDFELWIRVDEPSADEWTKLPILLARDEPFLIGYQTSVKLPQLIEQDLRSLEKSATESMDVVRFDFSCCDTRELRLKMIRQSVFTLMFDGDHDFQQRFFESLLAGSIPVILSTGQQRLPFDHLIDWRLAALKFPLARLPELHFILRSFGVSDLLEMKRRGRFFLENFLINSKVLTRSILSSLRSSLQIPGESEQQVTSDHVHQQDEQVSQRPIDEEFLGPLEPPIDSTAFISNYTAIGMYTYDTWNRFPQFIDSAPEFLPFVSPLPSGVEFESKLSAGLRPISPGSGHEFSQSLGGNYQREQFTIVILTHQRDEILRVILDKINRCPYVHSVIVVWNNLDRDPSETAWPKIHVPLIFVKQNQNSLNNRFKPIEQIRTEAVLSLDDDLDFRASEIVFAFRVWRENRDRLVGLPARYHANYNGELFYNSNHTCQLSMILTGASFVHKSFFHAYWNQMPPIIRQKVDEWMNCEDLAMNFLISHLTRKPPIKTTNKWTIRCPTCPETLSQGVDHFDKRSRCLRFFIQIYGYNPLLFTQFRADSVLYRTRVPMNHQKCFRFV
ncbi:Exostosin-like 3 [Aphelenchoides besseyi]|nr:Exostosin-like 3 [Aphelenchoides besseyi]